jgi:hypothetical protein
MILVALTQTERRGAARVDAICHRGEAARFSGDTDAFTTALALSCLQPHPLGEDEADDFFATSEGTSSGRR